MLCCVHKLKIGFLSMPCIQFAPISAFVPLAVSIEKSPDNSGLANSFKMYLWLNGWTNSIAKYAPTDPHNFGVVNAT